MLLLVSHTSLFSSSTYSNAPEVPHIFPYTVVVQFGGGCTVEVLLSVISAIL